MSIFDDIHHKSEIDGSFEQLTIGRVLDTNDPQQMGRVRILCPFFGDTGDTLVGNLPWATPISPLAGSAMTTQRGRGTAVTTGAVAYGMFNTPKVGAHALVGCIEGDPQHRIYLGCIHEQFAPHTLPHGRYTYKQTDNLSDEPSGPLSSSENLIQPLYDNQTETFTKAMDTIESGIPADARKNYEYRTRGADRSVAGIVPEFIGTEDVILSNEPDDVALDFAEADGNTISHTQGYDKTRVLAGQLSEATGDSLDTQTYSWTTPGFHSISMDDSAENCRIRLRTTHGMQLIMDDTNERIYVSTASGKSWIELDEQGNIDLYAERNISMHAEKDINFTAGDTFRVKAKNGIHLISEDEVRIHAKGSTGGTLHIKSDTDLIIHTAAEMRLQSIANFHGKFANTRIDATGTMDIKSSGNANIQSGGVLSLKAAGNILETGSQIHFNGPPAADAQSADDSSFKEAWWTNRVPEHEPWGRIMTKASSTDIDTGNTHAGSAEFTYDDSSVGRTERGETLNRNGKWHR